METNFNQPQRQSLVGILVIFLEMIFQLLKATWPIIIITLLKADFKSNLVGFLILLAIAVYFGIYSFLNYRNFTFYIDEVNEEFIISEGIINKTKTTIQLHKIQQVNIKQNLIQRLIGVYALDVDTAGSDKKEGNIKAVSHNLALALKSKLLENEGKKVAVSEDDIAAEKSEYKAIPFLKINLNSLLKIGITSNYVKSVGLILTFFFTIYENLHQAGAEDVISTEKLEGFVDNNSVWYSALVFILIMFSVVFLINILRTIIKFFDYTVTKQKGSLMLTYGLINTQSTILKPEKVQIVKVSSNYFQKKLNVLEIKIRQAISNEKKDNKSLIEIPGCNTTERDEILKLLFKQLPEKGVMMQPNFRRLIFSVFIIIVLPLAGYFLFGKYAEPIVFDYVNIAVFYTVFMLVLLFFGFRNYRLFVNDNHIIKQSGAWDVDHEIIEIGKIQAITTSQLFWHKNLNIGSLTMHTAGGNITFHLGQFDKINEYVNLWLYEIETSNRNWM
ncbi:PH domain-containing protein [Flavobacterium sp. J49]|uniref:PH domain-containing protein n=1 Tax=Flavobacterium sp. J49 TaxID=2718534 RepID=UPI001592DB44|nr:PH domain-containing protein [Flavobacterium sp. J49]MBF6642231.1 PH domain-containing protein [Flavobacterium sp. J49]NIC03477.1 PH domain-containing protein [Flavobacterium sp. J49]